MLASPFALMIARRIPEGAYLLHTLNTNVQKPPVGPAIDDVVCLLAAASALFFAVLENSVRGLTLCAVSSKPSPCAYRLLTS
jgi:hypothetical protein